LETKAERVFGTGAALFVLIASIYLLTAAGRFANYDAETMFGVTRSLYTHGSLEVAGCSQVPRSLQCVEGVDGKYYSGYGVVTSIVALPFLAVGTLIGKSRELDPNLVGAAFVAFMNSLVGALACALFFFWAVKAGCGVRASALMTLLLAFATPLWFHSTKEFYSEPLFTLFLVGSFAALRAGDSWRSASIAGLLFGLAVGARVFGLIYLPIVAGYAYLASAPHGLLTTRKWRIERTSSFLIAVLACLVVWGALNVSRFGGPLRTGYHTVLPTAASLFATPPLTGLGQILFNGEVGLVWFSPLVFLLPATWPRISPRAPTRVVCVHRRCGLDADFLRRVHLLARWVVIWAEIAHTDPAVSHSAAEADARERWSGAWGAEDHRPGRSSHDCRRRGRAGDRNRSSIQPALLSQTGVREELSTPMEEPQRISR
jgi:hypothetical protein